MGATVAMQVLSWKSAGASPTKPDSVLALVLAVTDAMKEIQERSGNQREQQHACSTSVQQRSWLWSRIAFLKTNKATRPEQFSFDLPDQR